MFEGFKGFKFRGFRVFTGASEGRLSRFQGSGSQSLLVSNVQVFSGHRV